MTFHLNHPELLFYPPEGTYENILNEMDKLFQKYRNQYQSDRKAQMNIQESELWSCEDAEELKSLFCDYIDDEIAKHEDVEIMVGKEDGRLILKFENVFFEPSEPFEEGTYLQIPPTQNIPSCFLPYPITNLLLPLVNPIFKFIK